MPLTRGVRPSGLVFSRPRSVGAAMSAGPTTWSTALCTLVGITRIFISGERSTPPFGDVLYGKPWRAEAGAAATMWAVTDRVLDWHEELDRIRPAWPGLPAGARRAVLEVVE